MATRRNIRYSHLPTEDRDGGHASEEADDDLRFTYTPKSHMRIPWKSIALAFFLLLIGILLLSLSYFIFTNHMEGDGSQAYGLLFLGVLAFLPGYYETRVAYYSWRGEQGMRAWLDSCVFDSLYAFKECVAKIQGQGKHRR